MNIIIEPKSISPRVKDHRGYSDMIFDLTIFLDCVDTETGSTIGYQIFKEFDTEFEYTSENQFKQFQDISEDEVNVLVENLISEERTYGNYSILEWAQHRFEQIYSEPIPKPFYFQTLPTPVVGIGSTDQQSDVGD